MGGDGHGDWDDVSRHVVAANMRGFTRDGDDGPT